MPEKEIRPRPGEVWKKRFKDGDDHNADEALCFIYEENGKLYKAWFAVPCWKSDLIKEDMIDSKNCWKRVYAPPDTSALGLLVPLK